jgi:hypothetical protein
MNKKGLSFFIWIIIAVIVLFVVFYSSKLKLVQSSNNNPVPVVYYDDTLHKQSVPITSEKVCDLGTYRCDEGIVASCKIYYWDWDKQCSDYGFSNYCKNSNYETVRSAVSDLCMENVDSIVTESPVNADNCAYHFKCSGLGYVSECNNGLWGLAKKCHEYSMFYADWCNKQYSESIVGLCKGVM